MLKLIPIYSNVIIDKDDHPMFLNVVKSPDDTAQFIVLDQHVFTFCWLVILHKIMKIKAEF